MGTSVRLARRFIVRAIFRRLWPLTGSPTLPFGLFGLSRPLAHTVAVFVDEFDAGSFNTCASYINSHIARRMKVDQMR